jgi:glycosyltransferase involved in cell wall biosynthesis
MNLYYFVHITGTDMGVSGIPRVVRNLARELVRMREVTFVPVCWSRDRQAIVPAGQKLLDNLSRHGGPALNATQQAPQPIAPSAGDWLLIAEAPHLQSHLAEFPPVHLDEVVGEAARRGLRVGIVFHDLLPLTFGVGGQAGEPFVELSPADLSARDETADRLAFARYAHATALADLVLPVSRTSGEALRGWWLAHGHRPERLPPIAPTLLPEQIFGAPREDPLASAPPAGTPIEFVGVGLVNAQKNQLAAMAAFLRLVAKRPELDLRLHLVGLIAPDVAVPVSLMVKRAKGRIVLHGRLPDAQVRALTRRSRAAVFVSLAEGFGLPVAESLWRGKPCLCSNSGSIAEIARGGGCLAVDPRSLEAIAEGFETLATDDDRYRQLLREIAARPFKTWSRYAAQIFDALCAVSCGRSPDIAEETAPVADAASEVEEPRRREAVLFLSAADWLVHDAYSAPHRARSLFHGGALHYDAKRDGEVEQPTLFFGPYVSLPAGRYAFAFDGELDGELKLTFTARHGALRVAETTVANFAQDLVFDLPEDVEGFEIVGARTPRLRRLTLRAAFGELRGPSQGPLAAAAASSGPPPAARPPEVIPASRLRVHDAYGPGPSNQLRDGAAIVYDRTRHGAVREPVLFFGPYARLEPGRYRLRLRGELEGPLNLRLTRDFGRDCLRELVLTSFDTEVLVEIDQPAENFEAVGAKTDATRSLRLTAIEIASAPIGDKRREPRSRAGGRSLLARVLRRG